MRELESADRARSIRGMMPPSTHLRSKKANAQSAVDLLQADTSLRDIISTEAEHAKNA